MMNLKFLLKKILINRNKRDEEKEEKKEKKENNSPAYKKMVIWL